MGVGGLYDPGWPQMFVQEQGGFLSATWCSAMTIANGRTPFVAPNYLPIWR